MASALEAAVPGMPAPGYSEAAFDTEVITIAALYTPPEIDEGGLNQARRRPNTGRGLVSPARLLQRDFCSKTRCAHLFSPLLGLVGCQRHHRDR
jgi:hypothetical protein